MVSGDRGCRSTLTVQTDVAGLPAQDAHTVLRPLIGHLPLEAGNATEDEIEVSTADEQGPTSPASALPGGLLNVAPPGRRLHVVSPARVVAERAGQACSRCHGRHSAILLARIGIRTQLGVMERPGDRTGRDRRQRRDVIVSSSETTISSRRSSG